MTAVEVDVRIEEIDLSRWHGERHGVSEFEVWQAFLNGVRVYRNKNIESGNARYVAHGETNGGRRLEMPFDFDHETRTATPRTGWDR